MCLLSLCVSLLFVSSIQAGNRNPETALLLNASDSSCPFEPSPWSVVDLMLQMADLSELDRLVDLGSGDGRVALVAVKNYNITSAVGYELQRELVDAANQEAERAGVSDRVSFRNSDMFQADLSPFTAVTMYLIPPVNRKLRPKFHRELRPGTKIVVPDYFCIGGLHPELTVRTTHADKVAIIGTTQVRLTRTTVREKDEPLPGSVVTVPLLPLSYGDGSIEIIFEYRQPFCLGKQRTFCGDVLVFGRDRRVQGMQVIVPLSRTLPSSLRVRVTRQSSGELIHSYEGRYDFHYAPPLWLNYLLLHKESFIITISAFDTAETELAEVVVTDPVRKVWADVRTDTLDQKLSFHFPVRHVSGEGPVTPERSFMSLMLTYGQYFKTFKQPGKTFVGVWVCGPLAPVAAFTLTVHAGGKRLLEQRMDMPFVSPHSGSGWPEAFEVDPQVTSTVRLSVSVGERPRDVSLPVLTIPSARHLAEELTVAKRGQGWRPIPGFVGDAHVSDLKMRYCEDTDSFAMALFGHDADSAKQSVYDILFFGVDSVGKELFHNECVQPHYSHPESSRILCSSRTLGLWSPGDLPPTGDIVRITVRYSLRSSVLLPSIEASPEARSIAHVKAFLSDAGGVLNFNPKATGSPLCTTDAIDKGVEIFKSTKIDVSYITGRQIFDENVLKYSKRVAEVVVAIRSAAVGIVLAVDIARHVARLAEATLSPFEAPTYTLDLLPLIERFRFKNKKHIVPFFSKDGVSELRKHSLLFEKYVSAVWDEVDSIYEALKESVLWVGSVVTSKEQYRAIWADAARRTAHMSSMEAPIFAPLIDELALTSEEDANVEVIHVEEYLVVRTKKSVMPGEALKVSCKAMRHEVLLLTGRDVPGCVPSAVIGHGIVHGEMDLSYIPGIGDAVDEALGSCVNRTGRCAEWEKKVLQRLSDSIKGEGASEL